MKKNIIALAIIIISAIGISIPLLHPGFYSVHDDQQIARLFVFDQALKAGQFPVRWVDGLGFGFGYPLFVFYPPFVYILAEVFHLLGFGFIDSIKLVFFTSIFASGVAMYIFAKELWGKLAAIVASIFYIFVPYRALDVYVRGALAESFSFVWLPLILWSFFKLTVTRNLTYIYLSSIFLALLMITHNLIFMPFMLILPFYLLFLICKSEDRKRSTVYCLLSTVIALCLSAFFWLPALLMKKFTIVDDLLLLNLASYKIHFVYPTQLWSWTWGFGGSAIGLADGISFKIGKLHILVSTAAFLITILFLIKERFKSKMSVVSLGPQSEGRGPHGTVYQQSVVFFCLFSFAAFMTTFYSKPIWDVITPLQYLQFPWRFLTFTALFSSLLAGYFIYQLKLPILKLTVSAVFIVLLVNFNLKLFKPQTYRLGLTDQEATSDETIKWYVSQSSFEYLPEGVELIKNDRGANVVNIEKGRVEKDRVEKVSGDFQITNLEDNVNKISFDVDARTISNIRVNIFNFPFWQAKIDNQNAVIDDNNRLKLVTLSVPSGNHNVLLEFKNTKVMNFANMISLISISTLLLLIISKLWTMRN